MAKRVKEAKDLKEKKSVQVEVSKQDEKKKKEKKEDKKNKEGYFTSLKEQLKKVKWPSGKEMFKYTFSTIVFVLLFVLFFQLIDIVSSFVKGLF